MTNQIMGGSSPENIIFFSHQLISQREMVVLVKQSELSLPQCQTRKKNHQEVLDFGYRGGSRVGGGG